MPSPQTGIARDSSFATAPPAHVPLAVVTRGRVTESLHSGSIAVVSRDGRLLYSAGDPHFATMTRSTLKPFQAVPFVAAGGVARFGYSTAQVALLCASHSGEPRHVEAVADMLVRAGNRPEELQCGAHAPGYFEALERTPPPPPYSVLAHNCSGKHSGMLAYCVLCDAPKGSYLERDHPLQRTIRDAVAHFSAVPADELAEGIDGCSAPNYAVPLARLAQAYARLSSPTDDARYGGALRELADAMTRHPEMVSGDRRSDLELARAGRGDWIAKIGAEGVQAIGVRSSGIGIAIKVGDGSKRALRPIIAAVMDALGLLDAAARAELSSWFAPEVRNYRGLGTGRIQSAVVLDKEMGSRESSRPSANNPGL